MHERLLTHAIKDGELVDIDSVERGIKCGCFCPSCGESLIAKKGSSNAHHFAHASGKSCAGSVQTVMHMQAKEILSKVKKIKVPPAVMYITGSHPFTLGEEEYVSIDKAKLEKRQDSIVPDIIVYSGEFKFYVEIFVTHAVDKTKLEKIKRLDVSTLEIDLSECYYLPPDEFKKYLIEDTVHKKWIYHKELEAWKDKCASIIKTYPVEYMQKAFPCYWNNAKNVNVYQCAKCPYFFYYDYEKGILSCSGESGIVNICDFSEERQKEISRERQEQTDKTKRETEQQKTKTKLKNASDLQKESVKKYLQKNNPTKFSVYHSNVSKEDKTRKKEVNQLLYNGICPECGSPLKARSGKYGWFIHCENYPLCTYVPKKCPYCDYTLTKKETDNEIIYRCPLFPACDLEIKTRKK